NLAEREPYPRELQRRPSAIGSDVPGRLNVAVSRAIQVTRPAIGDQPRLITRAWRSIGVQDLKCHGLTGREPAARDDRRAIGMVIELVCPDRWRNQRQGNGGGAGGTEIQPVLKLLEGQPGERTAPVRFAGGAPRPKGLGEPRQQT